jgi:hypothetical protein
MAAKPRFRIRSSVLAVITTAIGSLAYASPSLADTGGVYFDSTSNAGAGDPAQLFNGTFTGIQNVGLGIPVMPNLTTGNFNVAVGTGALLSDTSGGANFAAGGDALESDTTGNDNVAAGDSALLSNATGNGNVATGANALFATSGSANIALGSNAGANLTTGSNNIDIGNVGKAADQKAIRIGTSGTQARTFLAGVSGATLSGGGPEPVLINAKGQLGTTTAAAAKSGAAKPLSAAITRLRAQNRRQSQRIAGLEREVAKLTAH